MQKKVLLPLLLVGPVALPALADNVNFGFPSVSDWNGTGIMPDGFVIDPETNSVKGLVGAGVITSQKLSYPGGTYRLVFSAAENIKVSVNGEVLTATTSNGDTVYEFEVTNGVSFQISVESEIQAMPFSFTGSQLTLVFDVKAALQQTTNILRELRAYAATDIPEVNPDDTGLYFAQGDALRSQREKFMEDYKEGNPNTIVYPDGTEITAKVLYQLLNPYTTKEGDENLAELYVKYGYDQDPIYPVKYFQEQLDSMKALTASIELENEYFANYETNLGNYNGFESDYKTITDQIDAQTTNIGKIQGLDENLAAEYLGQLAAIKEDVEQWWAKVNDAYKQPIVPDNEVIWRESVIEMEALQTSFAEIQEELTKVTDQIGAADADWKIYYQVNYVMLPELKKAYEDLVNYLDSVEGVKGYEDNYDDYVAKVLEEATGYYNGAKDKIIPEIPGAEKYNTENECSSTIQTAIDWLKNQLTESQELVETQNGYMEDALADIADYQDQLETIKDETVVPSMFEEQWADLVKDVNDAISDFQKYVEGQYAEQTLDPEDATYVADEKAIEDALAALKQFAEDNNFAALNDIQNALDDAWKEIGDNYDEWVQGKMEDTRDNLQSAIDSLDPTDENDLNTEIGNIEKGIEDMLQSAADLNQAFDRINSMIEEIKGDMASFSSLRDSKEIQKYEDLTNDELLEYIKNYTDTEGNDYAEILALQSQYQTLFEQYKDLDGQECLNKLNELWDTMSSSNPTILEMIESAEVAFEKGGTQINWDWAESIWGEYLHELQALTPSSDYPGYDDAMSLSNQIDQTLLTIQGKIDAETTVKGFQGIDTEIKNLLGTIMQLKAQVQTIVDNKTAYDSMQTQLATLENWLEKLKEYNDTYSLTPAKEFFDGYISNTLQPEFDALKESVEKEFQAVTAYKNQATLNGNISAFDAKVLNAYKWIKNNNNNYNAQIAEATDVQAYINGLISDIDSRLEGMEEGTVSDMLNTWKEELQNLLTESTDPLNWADVNSLAFQYYGEGLAAGPDYNPEGDTNDYNQEILDDYAALKTAAKNIDDQLNGDTYHDAVVGANSSTTSNWEMTVNDLDDDYRAGIRDYNWFFFYPGLTNEGWRNYVEEKGIQTSHAVLQSYYEKIQSLNQEVLNWISDQNTANHVITTEEWDAKLAEAAAIATAIENQVEALITDMNQAAVEYYALLHGQVEDDIAEAKGILAAQGIPTSPYMDTIIANDAEAESEYAKAMGQPADASAQDQVGGRMNDIADLLDSCLPPYDYQSWAMQQWNSEYKDAQDTIGEYRDAINKADFADDDYRSAQMEQFEDIVGQIKDLNDKVTGTTEGLIDEFGDYSDQLEDLLSQLETIKDNIQSNSDNNKAEQDAYNDFVNSQLPSLNVAFDDLDAYAKSLAGCASKTIGDQINGDPFDQDPYDGIKGQIESLANMVEKNKGGLTKLNPSVDDQVANIQANIMTEYRRVANAETTYLTGTLYKDAKEAFNNAYKFVKESDTDMAAPEGYDSWESFFNEMDEKINSYEGSLGAAGDFGASFTYDTHDAWKEEAVDMERALCEIFTALQNVWTDNPVTAVVDGLNAIADEIQNKLTEAEGALNGYEYLTEEQKAEFQAKYDELQKALDAEKALWPEEGDWVIARDGFHKVALEFLGYQIADVAADAAEAAQAAQDAADQKAQSDARYDELLGEYNDLVDQFNELKDQIGGYSEDVQNAYADTLDKIQSLLDEAYQNLQEGKEAGSLTASSELLNGDNIQSQITSAQLGAARMQANLLLGDTKTARDNASDALKKHIVPEVYAELIGQYNSLNSELNNLLDDVLTAGYDELTQIIERAPELTDLFNSIVEQAVENSYILGDVNLNPDGVVNVVDVQLLINMVGDDVSYQELYAENPRQALAADVTGDKEINIADVTTLIQWIINDQVEEMNKLRVNARTATDVESAIELQLVDEYNGIRKYAVNLINGQAFRGGQFDIIASGSAEVRTVADGERTSEHMVMTFFNPGSTRVVIASMSNKEIEGSNGNIAYIEVEGNGDIAVSNAIFSDTANRAHKLNKAEASGVGSFLDQLKGYGEKVYDAAGRMYNKVQRGINIIRHKDGSVTKEIRK